ncbi:MAG TPA: signal peptidase I [Candidatus Sulfotelmatobacter sp.]|nr:signal peptidase I [Candidatus Sulfotelmatobacter sp.]
MDAETQIAEVPPAAAQARHEPHRTSFAEYAESLLVTLLLALFGTTFIVQAFKIPSQSMEPTLLVGDHLLVNKFLFEGRGAWYEKVLPYRPIRNGDILVFKFPYDDHQHYVKRVIGVPGDRIHIRDGQVYLNGHRLPEPYVVHDPAGEDPFGENFPPKNRDFIGVGPRPEWAEKIMDYVQRGELVVPPNRYFVMGDNRDRSADSRYWGFVHRDAVMGRPLVIYWSVAATSSDYASRGLAGTLRGIGDTLLHLPARTRWNRMLHEVH